MVLISGSAALIFMYVFFNKLSIVILSYCRSAIKVKYSFKSVSLVAYSFVSQFFPSPTCWCLISSTSHSSLSLLHLFLHLQILPLSHP